MRRTWVFFLAVLWVGGVWAQATTSDRAAKDAVQRIVRHSGLQPNFVVREDPTLRTAVAYIKDKQRVIAYNAAFINGIVDSTGTNWSAISILAHEIGHHLLGHTLDPEAVRPGDELACDRYSGFILAAMGVPLADALAAMEVAGDPHGTAHHPPKHARLSAIEQGWHEWFTIRNNTEPLPFTLHDDLQYVVAFHGDANTYYVDATDQVLWYDNYAAPIPFGHFAPSRSKDYTYELVWNEEVYYVDRRLTIWKRAAAGMVQQVGRMRTYGRE